MLTFHYDYKKSQKLPSVETDAAVHDDTACFFFVVVVGFFFIVDMLYSS